VNLSADKAFERRIEFIGADVKPVFVSAYLRIVGHTGAARALSVRGVHLVNVVRAHGIGGLADSHVEMGARQRVSEHVKILRALQNKPAVDRLVVEHAHVGGKHTVHTRVAIDGGGNSE